MLFKNFFGGVGGGGGGGVGGFGGVERVLRRVVGSESMWVCKELCLGIKM